MKNLSRDRAFDDFSIGDTIQSKGRTVTETDVVMFTGIAGIKAPIFVDAEHCKLHSPFGRRIVPGLLTAAIAAGMMEDVLGFYTVAALEIKEMKFPTPLFPNDTVSAQIHIVDTKPTSDGKHGVITVRNELHNQGGVQVFEFTGKLLMKRAL